MASGQDDLRGTSSSSGLNLTENQIDALQHFKEVTGLTVDEIAIHSLESNNWNLEAAVHSFMGLGDTDNQRVRRRNVPPPMIDISPMNQHIFRADPETTWFSQITYFALAPLRFVYNVFADLFQFIVSFIWPQTRPAVTDPRVDVREFIKSFKKKYLPPAHEGQGESGVDVITQSPPFPPFFNATYEDAVKEAKRSLRFLIVYLHGDSHQHSDAFCRETLLHPDVLAFLNNSDQVMFWACNVNSTQGYLVSQTLRENTYPFIGVVGLSSNPAYSPSSFGPSTRMALVGRIEGMVTAASLIQQLIDIMDRNQAVLVAERADRAERELSSRLRREQDEAFAASLAQDRAKAAARAAAQEEAERRVREAEQQQRRAALLCRARVRRQRHWAASLPPAPPKGQEGTLCLSLKMPSGRRAERVFSSEDSAKLLYYFILSQEDAPTNFSVHLNYPKRSIECRPGDESDIEEYIPSKDADEDGVDIDMPRKQVEDWKPRVPSDPPAFKDFGLSRAEMLLVQDLDV